MAAQVPPSEDDCHWKSKLGVSPCQLPLPAVSVSSLDASPLIEGAMRLTGAAASGPEPDSGTDPVREGVVGVAGAGADVVGLGVLGCVGFGVFGGTTVRARIRFSAAANALFAACRHAAGSRDVRPVRRGAVYALPAAASALRAAAGVSRGAGAALRARAVAGGSADSPTAG